MRNRLIRALPFLVFAALTLAVFWKFLLFGHTLYAVHQLEIYEGRTPQAPSGWFRPDRPPPRLSDNLLLLPSHLRVFNEGLKEGEFRLWNPAMFGGLPITSDPMVHPFYPPDVVLHFLLPPLEAYETGLMLHLFFSGVAMFWLLRVLGRGRVAATGGAVIWMIPGYAAMWFSMGILGGIGVFGPLAVGALVGGLQRRRLAGAPLAALAMGGAVLGSHPQHAVLFFLFPAAWLVTSWARAGGDRPFVARFATAFLLLTVGISLVSILAVLEAVTHGSRAPGFDHAVLYGSGWIQPAPLLGLALGKVWWPSPSWVAAEFAMYLGLAGLAAAVVGAVRGFREPFLRFATVFGAAGLLVASLRPLAELAQILPLLNISPSPRWIGVSGFCLALLAARGLDEPGLLGGRVRWVLAVVTGAFLFGCVLSLGPASFSNGKAVETALGFGLATAAAFIARARPAAGAAAWTAVLVFELLPHFLMLNFHADPAVMKEPPAAVRWIREQEEPGRATGALGSLGPTPDHFTTDLISGNNLMALYGVETIAGFEAVIPGRYWDFCVRAGAATHEAGRTMLFADYRSRLLDLANLRWLAFPYVPGNLPSRFREVFHEEGLRVYENGEVLPRAFVVSGVVAVKTPEEAMERISASGFDPATAVVLETDEEIPARPPGRVGARIDWVERSPERVVLDAESAEGGVLFVSDTHYPGWEAELDGTPARLYRANGAFRAVALPPGKHRVAFHFRPAWVGSGLLGSAAFALLALGYALFLRRRPRPTAGS